MKKYKVLFVLFLLILTLSSVVYASTLEVVDSNSNTRVEDNNIRFTKKIISHDSAMKEAEIELKIENLQKIEQQEEKAEIVIVLDNSGSMSTIENNNTRKNTTYNATSKFVDMLFDSVSNLKVGIIQYATQVSVISGLTESKSDVLGALQNYKQVPYGGNTATDDALQTVRSQFSPNCKNKIVVLFTDGYPNNPTLTKQQLLSIGQSDISVISLIVCKKENMGTIQGVFGTEQNPTAGKVFYIETDSEIDRLFNEFAYDEIKTYLEHPVTNIEIEDIFPEDILKYYNIEYPNLPSKGQVNNVQNNDRFVWKIDELIGKESSTFRYKLKIKDNIDESPIIGIPMRTNETVKIKYTDEYKQAINRVLKKQPVIKLIESESQMFTVSIDDDNIEIGQVVQEDKKIEVVQEETKIPDGTNQEYIVVEIKQPEENKPQEIKNEIPTTSKVEKTPTQKEKLPQTGLFEQLVLGISILLCIFLAIKLKLATKDIIVVRK